MPSARSYTPSGPRSPLRYSSTSSQSPALQAKADYATSPIGPTAPYTPSYSAPEMALLSYPGSPSPSVASTLSASGLDLHELYSPGIGKFMCPLPGCLYGVLGFPTTDELDHHITVLGHYPEPAAPAPQASLDPRVTILNYESAREETDSWLATQQELDGYAAYGSYPPAQYAEPAQSPFQFTFTFEQPAGARKKAQQPPASPTASQCDCPHCHTQNLVPFPVASSGGRTGSKRSRSIYDYSTPLTVQLAPPITIIGLPTLPAAPSSAAPAPVQTQTPPKPAAAAKKTTAPNPNDYAVWQQKIQIAQATEMIQAQHRQRESQRRKRDHGSSSHTQQQQLEIQIPPAQTYTTYETDYYGYSAHARSSAASLYGNAAGYSYPINPVC
ncbi:hypothetical protein DFH27DRAFT_584930 [Peziza echinospora]|nr:hypothetical protein DFH27DRAFT_584930 [Peziza echinospora]